jgi:crotonobetainyl-CoA:carnitine CoA-transferase CaiB-like acyl-CoA transferase
MGNRHPTIVPYETFPTADGEFVLAVGNDDQWRRFCIVAGLEPQERFATNRLRVENYEQLKPILDGRLRAETRAYWIERLAAAGIPCGSVRDLHEVFSDPQVAARAMVAELEHAKAGMLKLVGTPLKFSETPGEIRTPPPMLGEHTTGVLTRDLGLAATDVAALRAQGVV